MLWTYLDESGEHNPKGHSQEGQLSRLTVGGGIARLEQWEELSLGWASVLDRYQIPAFHMTDFEARRPPFDWPETKRRDLLGALLDLALENVQEFIGFIGQPEAGKAALVDAYETCVAKIS
jgi:hypothetical protein